MDKKKCSKCSLVKDISEFHRNKASKDGYCGKCKECKKDYMKDYMKANKEKLKEYIKDYRLKNKDKIAKKKKDYMKEYYLKNKDKDKVNKQRRRARLRSLANTLTVEEWNQTLNDFNFSCANCGSREKNLHMDHFIALSDDNCPGTTKKNCIPLCATCNCSKGSKHPKDFFSEEKLVEIMARLGAIFVAVSG